MVLALISHHQEPPTCVSRAYQFTLSYRQILSTCKGEEMSSRSYLNCPSGRHCNTPDLTTSMPEAISTQAYLKIPGATCHGGLEHVSTLRPNEQSTKDLLFACSRPCERFPRGLSRTPRTCTALSLLKLGRPDASTSTSSNPTRSAHTRLHQRSTWPDPRRSSR